MSRAAATVLAVALLGAALLGAYIGAADILTAITGHEQDSPAGVLILVGGGFLLASAALAWLGLRLLMRSWRAGPPRRAGS